MKRKEIKQHARKNVQKNLIMAAVLLIVPVAIQTLVSAVFSSLGSFGSFIGGVASFALTAFISVGYASAYLRLHRSGEGQLADLLTGVRTWERSLLLGVWYWVFSFAWTIVPAVLLIGSVTFIVSVFFTSQTLTPGLLAFGLVTSLGLGFIGLFVQIRYGFAVYLLMEEPTMDPKTCISESKRMMQGRYMEMIQFYFSFFWWFFASAMSFGIVGLFVVPYILTAYAGVYDEFRGQAVAVKATVVPNPTPISVE